MAVRSLGRLTLDLVAKTGGFETGMDKARRKSKSTFNSIEKNANKAAKVMAGFTATSIAGLATLTAGIASNARETQNLARVANASNEEFQRGVFAARRFNIEQEKYADILKDVTDKVGDFLQTGGGPLADFFENIAPKVGVTAEQFARLSGPEALQLYVDSLEKANVTQSEMTFFMEAIASDATMLLPLLKNNGAEFKRLGDEAERTGNVLSDVDFAELQELTATVDNLKSTYSGLSTEIAFAAVPAINDLTELLSDQGTVENAKALGNAIVVSVKAAVETINGAINVVRFLGEEIAAAVGGPAADDIARIEERISDLRETIERESQSTGAVEGSFWWKVYGGNDEEQNAVIRRINAFKEELTDLENLRDEYYQNEQQRREREKAALLDSELDSLLNDDSLFSFERGRPQRTFPGVKDEEAEKQKKAMEAYRDLVAELRTDEEKLNDQLRERLAILDAVNMTADSESISRIVSAGFEESPEFQGLAPEIGGPLGELNKIDDAREAQEEWYETQLGMLEQYRKDRSDLTSQWDEQEKRLKEEHEQKIADIESARQMAQLAVTEETFGALADLTGAFAGKQSGIYKAMFAAQKAFTLKSVLMSSKDAIADAWASAPFPANLPAVLTTTAETGVLSAFVSSLSPPTGMAHDGIDSIPKTGSWFLEKGERVTTAETSAKLDRTLDNLKMGGGEKWTINQNNYGTVSDINIDHERRMIEIATRVATEQMTNPSSRGRQGMAQNSNLMNRGTR